MLVQWAVSPGTHTPARSLRRSTRSPTATRHASPPPGPVCGSILPASASSATGSSTASHARSGCPMRTRLALKPRASARFRRFRTRSIRTRLTYSTCAPTATSGRFRRSIGRSATSRRAASRPPGHRVAVRRTDRAVLRSAGGADAAELDRRRDTQRRACGGRKPFSRGQRLRPKHCPRLFRGPQRRRHELCDLGAADGLRNHAALRTRAVRSFERKLFGPQRPSALGTKPTKLTLAFQIATIMHSPRPLEGRSSRGVAISGMRCGARGLGYVEHSGAPGPPGSTTRTCQELADSPRL